MLEVWRGYTDEAAFIFAETDGEPHNTITPIARKKGDMYELDLTLRNNITTEENPLGVYHPTREQTHFQLLYEEPHQYCLYQDDRTSEGILLPTAHVFQSSH